MTTTLVITFLLMLFIFVLSFIYCWITLPDLDEEMSQLEFLFEIESHNYTETKDEYVPFVLRSIQPPEPAESIKFEDPVIVPKPKQKTPKKPEIDKQKLQDYCDILKAIGFTTSEAKSKTKSLLTQNPKLTEKELLREATK